MKITFVNPNRYMGYGRPPLGLLSLATVCRASGFDASILDADLLKLEAEDVAAKVAGSDVIGLTAMTPAIGEAMRIALEVKLSFPDKFVLLGGVHASVFPDKMVETKLFDVVVAGEGELAIQDVLNDIKTGELKPFYRARRLESIPIPDYGLLDVTRYIPRYPHGTRQPWTCVSTSRGCPYRCTFCSKSVFGKKYRAMRPDDVARLLESLCTEYQIKDITFYDDEFTIDRTRVIEICRLIKDFGLTWTCEARVDLVDGELLESMAGAGCRLIFYGIESGNQHLLDTLKKDITVEQVRITIRLTKMAGIQTAGYFMLGIPGETVDTINRTLQFCKELELDHAQFSICTPLPGSEMYQKCGMPDTDGIYLGNGARSLFAQCSLATEDIEQAVEYGNSLFRRD